MGFYHLPCIFVASGKVRRMVDTIAPEHLIPCNRPPVVKYIQLYHAHYLFKHGKANSITSTWTVNPAMENLALSAQAS